MWKLTFPHIVLGILRVELGILHVEKLEVINMGFDTKNMELNENFLIMGNKLFDNGSPSN